MDEIRIVIRGDDDSGGAFASVNRSLARLRTQVTSAVRAAGAGQRIDIPLRADAARLRADVTAAVRGAGNRITVPLHTDGAHLRGQVTAAVRAARTGQRIDVPLHLDEDRFRGRVTAAIRAAQVRQRITIPVHADGSTLRGEVQAALRWANYTGNEMKVTLGLEDPRQLRRDVVAAVRWAAWGHAINIPMRLDSDGVLAQLAAIRAGMTGLNTTIRVGGNTVSEASGNWKLMGAIAVGVLAGITVAAPIAAAAISATLPIAFIGMGAAALKGNKDVTDAFDNMKNDVSSAIKEAAAPMAPFLIEGMALAADGARQLKGPLTDAFSAAGPLVEPVVNGVVALATNAMPGFNAALSRSGPMMEAFGGFLGDIGTGLGGMFDEITRGNDANLARVWSSMGDGTEDLFISLGNLLGQLTRNQSALRSIDALFAGLISTIDATADVLDMLAPAVELALSAFAGGAQGIAWVTEQYRGMFETISEGSKSGTGSITRLKTGVDGARISQVDFSGAAGRVTKELEAQREATDSLITVLFDLANASQGAMDAQSGLEQAIDDGMKAARDNAGALRMVNGELDLNKQSARDAYDGLSNIATAAKKSAEEVHASTGSWEKANAEISKGRKNFLEVADAAGLSTSQAQSLADTLGLIPDKKIDVKLDREDTLNGLSEVQAAIRKTPGAKSVKVRTLSSGAIKALNAVGLKTRRLPDGRTEVYTKNGQSLGSIGAVNRALNNLNGKTAHTYTTHHVSTIRKNHFFNVPLMKATGGVVGRAVSRAAEGGPRSNRVMVGEQGPEVVDLAPGSMVHTAGATRRMMQGGGGREPIVLEVRSGGSRMDDLLVELLRHAIHARGGDPVKVLSPRGR